MIVVKENSIAKNHYDPLLWICMRKWRKALYREAINGLFAGLLQLWSVCGACARLVIVHLRSCGACGWRGLVRSNCNYQMQFAHCVATLIDKKTAFGKSLTGESALIDGFLRFTGKLRLTWLGILFVTFVERRFHCSRVTTPLPSLQHYERLHERWMTFW